MHFNLPLYMHMYIVSPITYILYEITWENPHYSMFIVMTIFFQIIYLTKEGFRDKLNWNMKYYIGFYIHTWINVFLTQLNVFLMKLLLMKKTTFQKPLLQQPSQIYIYTILQKVLNRKLFLIYIKLNKWLSLFYGH